MYSSAKLIKNEATARNFTKLALIFNSSRSKGISCRSYLSKNYHTRPIKIVNQKRYFSNQNANKSKTNYVPLVIGGVAVGGVGAYIYYSTQTRKATELIDLQDDDMDEPFIYGDLKEDLKLLNEFGPVPYLLVGAGNAAFAAFRAIRVNNPKAKVLMIGDERFYPYMRPPLTKEMWFEKKEDVAETLSFTQWSGKERSVFYEHEDYYFSIGEMLENKNGGVSAIRGKKVVKIDPVTQSVFLDTGEEIKYEKCLIATGAKPKNLPVFEQADKSVKKHVTLFRGATDFQKLDKVSRSVKSIVIVGGGFLGSELAYGLTKRGAVTGLKVTQVFPESGNMGMVLPEYLSKWTSKKLESEGVIVVPEVTVKVVANKNNSVELLLSNDEVITADHVVVAVGADANTEIAKASDLEVDEKHGGFVVNTEMEARKNLWVAGDASCFYDAKLGRRRVEHHDHAVVSGRLAGENMTESGKPYIHQSMFWSDLGPDIGFEAIGIIDSKLPTVAVFAKPTESDSPKTVADETENSNESELKEKSDSLKTQAPRAPESSDNYGKGVVFYLRDDVIVGLVMWNVFSKMNVARKIINESKSYDDLAEVAKLFELHSTEE